MARSKSKNVGVIGLGIIGSRVAGALRKKGFHAFVWNRTPRLEQNFVGSPAEVAELCDLVQIFVADDEALLAIVHELNPTLTAQHILTAHCTVAPESMRAAAELVQRRGARFLEAPFTGSKVAAEKGQLVYYVSGDDATLKQARPILEASSKEIVYIGEKIGEASVIKVATNIVTAATAQVAAEALALVRKAGLPAELFTRAMKSNATNSTTIEMKAPLMVAGDFEPHFSVKHMLKDVRIGLKLAQEHALDLPVAEVSGEMLLAEMKQGRGDADYSSVAQRYFPISTTSVRQETTPPVPVSNPVAPPPEEKKVPPTQPIAPSPEVKELPVQPVPPLSDEKVLPDAPPPEAKERPLEPVEKSAEPAAPIPENVSQEEDKEPEQKVAENGSPPTGLRGWFGKRRFTTPRKP